MDGDRRSFRLSPSSGERLGIGIEPKYLDLRMETLDEYHQGASAAADVENAVGRANGGLIEEHLPDRVATE